MLIITLYSLGWSELTAAAAQGVSPAERLLEAQNPVLAILARINPPAAQETETTLLLITTGTKRFSLRSVDGATPGEAQQIRANPKFAEAYDYSPAATLRLLRSVNQILSRSPLAK